MKGGGAIFKSICSCLDKIEKKKNFVLDVSGGRLVNFLKFYKSIFLKNFQVIFLFLYEIEIEKQLF